MPRKITRTRGAKTLQRHYRSRKMATSFSSKVKQVINKVAEKKRWNKIISQALGVPNGTFTTFNLLDGLIQGTNTAQRIGDKVLLKSIRIGLDFSNYASSVATSTCRYRMLIFRGKYDYSATNYPFGEVFESNAGSTPSYLLTSPVDVNQVTALYDITFTMTPAFSGQKCSTIKRMLLPVNKSFNFRDDDTYGKVSNLYLGLYQVNDNGFAVDITGNVQINFTDV